MTRAYIGIGSNINPSKNVLAALVELSRMAVLKDVSTVYSTVPENRPEQRRYYNCVAAIETELPAGELKRLVLREIEESLGRKREDDRHAARTIDLDILLYNGLIMKNREMTLPDPQLFERPYCAIPLAELEPGLRIPGGDSTIDEVAGKFSTRGMRILGRYTHEVRKRLGIGSKGIGSGRSGSAS